MKVSCDARLRIDLVATRTEKDMRGFYFETTLRQGTTFFRRKRLLKVAPLLRFVTKCAFSM